VIQACAARYLRDNPKQEKLLRPFCRYLRWRRTRALRSFVKSADRLFGFCPPAKIAMPGSSPATRETA
jgi:hypothetical protein